MPDAEISSNDSTPWHLWAVGVATIIWNSMGVMDFTMTMTHNESYMSSFTEEQLSFFYGFPIWINILWAVAVFGSLLGSLLLLLKNKFACKVFVVSFVALVITTIRNYGFAKGMEISGDSASLLFTTVIFLISLLLIIYARLMINKGVLN